MEINRNRPNRQLLERTFNRLVVKAQLTGFLPADENSLLRSVARRLARGTGQTADQLIAGALR